MCYEIDTYRSSDAVQGNPGATCGKAVALFPQSGQTVHALQKQVRLAAKSHGTRIRIWYDAQDRIHAAANRSGRAVTVSVKQDGD